MIGSYNNSDVLLFGKNKVSIDLKGLQVAIDLGKDVAIDYNAKVVVELLSIDELKRLEMMSQKGLRDISEQVCKDKVVDVISIYGNTISYDFSVAGLTHLIITSLIAKTKEVLANLIEVYTAYAENVLIIEQMAAIIAKYMTIPYVEVIKYPVTEILRLHAICAASFAEVIDLRPKEEELDK